MSKGMSNLISSTYAAQNNKIILHVGYNVNTKYCKMSSDKDCLPADITNYRLAQFDNMDDLQCKVAIIEKMGYTVCIDTEYYFYETAGVE